MTNDTQHLCIVLGSGRYNTLVSNRSKPTNQPDGNRVTGVGGLQVLHGFKPFETISNLQLSLSYVDTTIAPDLGVCLQRLTPMSEAMLVPTSSGNYSEMSTDGAT